MAERRFGASCLARDLQCDDHTASNKSQGETDHHEIDPGEIEPDFFNGSGLSGHCRVYIPDPADVLDASFLAVVDHQFVGSRNPLVERVRLQDGASICT